MKKLVLSLFMIIMLLSLAACKKEDGVPTQPTEPEPTVQYDWMAGESPVEPLRISRVRAGVNNINHSVAPDGTYFLSRGSDDRMYVLYSDHGSDQIIKLCGRPDCRHLGNDCNACVENGVFIGYYQGYVYVVSSDVALIDGRFMDDTRLWRMNLDGSNRMEPFDLTDFAVELAGEGGTGGVQCAGLNNGYLTLVAETYAQENGELIRQPDRYFYYKVDGSEGAPKEYTQAGYALYYCGDVLLTLTNESKYGSEKGAYWDYNLQTNEPTYLTDHPGVPGWFGKEEGYYMRGGDLMRLNYATRTEEVVLETGLEGDYYAQCYPDCIIIASREMGVDGDKHLYFYNWDYQLVDKLEVEFANEDAPHFLVAAETAQQIMLVSEGGFADTCPTYYINKSELGTGRAEIHPYNMPEL